MTDQNQTFGGGNRSTNRGLNVENSDVMELDISRINGNGGQGRRQDWGNQTMNARNGLPGAMLLEPVAPIQPAYVPTVADHLSRYQTENATGGKVYLSSEGDAAKRAASILNARRNLITAEQNAFRNAAPQHAQDIVSILSVVNTMPTTLGPLELERMAVLLQNLQPAISVPILQMFRDFQGIPNGRIAIEKKLSDPGFPSLVASYGSRLVNDLSSGADYVQKQQFLTDVYSRTAQALDPYYEEQLNNIRQQLRQYNAEKAIHKLKKTSYKEVISIADYKLGKAGEDPILVRGTNLKELLLFQAGIKDKIGQNAASKCAPSYITKFGDKATSGYHHYYLGCFENLWNFYLNTKKFKVSNAYLIFYAQSIKEIVVKDKPSIIEEGDVEVFAVYRKLHEAKISWKFVAQWGMMNRILDYIEKQQGQDVKFHFVLGTDAAIVEEYPQIFTIDTQIIPGGGEYLNLAKVTKQIRTELFKLEKTKQRAARSRRDKFLNRDKVMFKQVAEYFQTEPLHKA